MYPSPWQHYSSCLCTIPSLCSLQHCRSFPAHLLRDLGHHRGGSYTRGALAHPRGGKSLQEEMSLPHSSDPKPKSSIFGPPVRGSGLKWGGSCRNRQSEESVLAACTYCRNVLAVCEPGSALHGRAVSWAHGHVGGRAHVFTEAFLWDVGDTATVRAAGARS